MKRIIMIDFIAMLAIVMCALGIGLSIYLLATCKIDTRLPTINMLLCFYGIGWMSFLMQSIQHVSLSFFGGVLTFFIGFIVWSYKHLKIVDKVYRKLANKENIYVQSDGGSTS